MYNLLKRQAEVEILPMADALGLAVVPYGPTAGGLLTGKYAGRRPAGDTRFGADAMYEARYRDAANWDAAEAFARLAAELGHRPATLAVAWVAAHPAVDSVLLGARNAVQLEDTLAAADLDLDPEVRARIADLTPLPPLPTDRSEERTLPAGVRRQAPPCLAGLEAAVTIPGSSASARSG
jgi:aryl-alcohol dehydrogenase-like predicted oxidoreductase